MKESKRMEFIRFVITLLGNFQNSYLVLDKISNASE